MHVIDGTGASTQDTFVQSMMLVNGRSLGTVVNHYRYDAFGSAITTGTSETVANEFKYTGEQLDANTGFYYLRARYYAPGIGRFISRDPFNGFDADPMSLHKYLYVNNAPVDLVDPSAKTFLSNVMLAVWARMYFFIGFAGGVRRIALSGVDLDVKVSGAAPNWA